jgi:uncharacterized membrane protein (UPF0127 family)
MKPFVESPTTDSERPAKWAIELNDGAAAAAGVEPGQHLTVPPEAQYSSE